MILILFVDCKGISWTGPCEGAVTMETKML